MFRVERIFINNAISYIFAHKNSLYLHVNQISIDGDDDCMESCLMLFVLRTYHPMRTDGVN